MASLFSKKAKLWTEGRTKTNNYILDNTLKNFSNGVWIHVSSLGEFEQARPLIEKIKKENPAQKIVLSFYSPSGYEVRKNFPLADLVLYIPCDTSNKIKSFIDQLSPKLVIWVRYEFWYYTLRYLKEKNIPVYLISASFRTNQIFFKPYGTFFLSILNYFEQLFVINLESEKLLHKYNIQQVMQIPDTRMDRVIEIASTIEIDSKIKQFLFNKECLLVAGSTWQADIDILSIYINNHPEYAYIIAPHHIDEMYLKHIEQKLTIPNIRFSKLENKESTFENVLIIDNFGMLASLYSLGKYTYVGGGFGKSVHNVLEAIVHQKPVMFGPHHHKQYECGILIQKKIAEVVYTSGDIKNKLDYLQQHLVEYTKICDDTKQYILENKGATNRIYHIINKHL